MNENATQKLFEFRHRRIRDFKTPQRVRDFKVQQNLPTKREDRKISERFNHTLVERRKRRRSRSEVCVVDQKQGKHLSNCCFISMKK